MNVFVDDSSLRDIAGAIREKTGSTAAMKPGQMAAAIRGIESGGGSADGPLDPMEVYRTNRPADWLPMPTPQENEVYMLVHIPEGASTLLAFVATCDSGWYKVEIGDLSNGEFAVHGTDSVESGTAYEAELFAYDYGYPNVEENRTGDGMRQCLVKVSGDINFFAFNTHSRKTSPDDFRNWNIVEIAYHLPNAYIKPGGASSTMALTKLRYYAQYGTTNGPADATDLFRNCTSLEAVLSLDTSQATNMKSMFHLCDFLKAIPKINTANVTAMNSMFNGCSSLTTIPALDTAKVTNMMQMFASCNSLTTIPALDTAKVTNMGSMFYYCRSLTKIPELDTANVTNMNGMFNGCSSLTTIPALDTANVTDMTNMFYDCILLTKIPILNTAKVTNMDSMFRNCNSLTTIPALDTANVTDMGSMFYSCRSLTAIPALDTGKVTDMSRMFYSCRSLTAIRGLNKAKPTNVSFMFSDCSSLQSVLLDPTVQGWAGCAISLLNASLGHFALVGLFNSLPAITASKAITLTGNPGVSELTDAEKAIATGKGWTLTL